jgi:hypothetical protein
MTESISFKLGRWFGQLPLLGKAGVVIGGLAVTTGDVVPGGMV